MFHAGHAGFYVPLALPCYSSVCRLLHHLTETSHSGRQTGRRWRQGGGDGWGEWGWGRLWGWRQDEENNKSRQKERHEWRGEEGKEEGVSQMWGELRNKRDEIWRGRKRKWCLVHTLKTINFYCAQKNLVSSKTKLYQNVHTLQITVTLSDLKLSSLPYWLMEMPYAPWGKFFVILGYINKTDLSWQHQGLPTTPC